MSGDSRDSSGDETRSIGGYSPARFTPAAPQPRRKGFGTKQQSRTDTESQPAKPAKPAKPARSGTRGRSGRSGTPNAPHRGPATRQLEGPRERLLDTVRAVINRYELRASGAMPASIAVTGVGHRTDSGRVARAFADVLAGDLACTTCLVHCGWLEGHAPISSAADEASASGSYEFTVDEAVPLLTELTFGALAAQRRNAFVRSSEFAELLGELSDKYEHVVYDLPSVLDSPGAFVVMGHADAAVLVVKHRSTPLSLVERVRTTIEPTPTLAVVVNSFRPSIPRPLRRLFGN